jgi:hypothetical protein
MGDTINISNKNIEGKCDLKCAYNFTYNDAIGTAKNDGDNLIIVPEDREDYAVIYNKEKYRVFWIILNNSSSILYEDKQTDAELVISHISESGKWLLVFIPIINSTNSNSATGILSEIIKAASVSAPSKGNEVIISGIDLQNIVPNKPFFNCMSDNYDNYECICFGMLDAIPIGSSSLDILKKIITPTTMSYKITGGLFYNASGPNTTTDMGDGIYISCNPTGSSIETTNVKYEKNKPIFDMLNILDNPYFIIFMQIIFACIVFILVCYIWNYGFKFLDDDFGNKPGAVAKPAPK